MSRFAQTFVDAENVNPLTGEYSRDKHPRMPATLSTNTQEKRLPAFAPLTSSRRPLSDVTEMYTQQVGKRNVLPRLKAHEALTFSKSMALHRCSLELLSAQSSLQQVIR